VTYKDKVKGKRPMEPFNGQQYKKPKMSQNKQKEAEVKSKDDNGTKPTALFVTSQTTGQESV
jgi:hypothetical protein